MINPVRMEARIIIHKKELTDERESLLIDLWSKNYSHLNMRSSLVLQCQDDQVQVRYVRTQSVNPKPFVRQSQGQLQMGRRD